MIFCAWWTGNEANVGVCLQEQVTIFLYGIFTFPTITHSGMWKAWNQGMFLCYASINGIPHLGKKEGDLPSESSLGDWY